MEDQSHDLLAQNTVLSDQASRPTTCIRRPSRHPTAMQHGQSCTRVMCDTAIAARQQLKPGHHAARPAARTRVPHDLKVWRQAGALLNPVTHAGLLLLRPLKGALVGEDERLIARRQPGHHQENLQAVWSQYQRSRQIFTLRLRQRVQCVWHEMLCLYLTEAACYPASPTTQPGDQRVARIFVSL